MKKDSRYMKAIMNGLEVEIDELNAKIEKYELDKETASNNNDKDEWTFADTMQRMTKKKIFELLDKGLSHIDIREALLEIEMFDDKNPLKAVYEQMLDFSMKVRDLCQVEYEDMTFTPCGIRFDIIKSDCEYAFGELDIEQHGSLNLVIYED